MRSSSNSRNAKLPKPGALNVFSLAFLVFALLAPLVLALAWMDWALGVSVYRNVQALDYSHHCHDGFVIESQKKGAFEVIIRYSFTDEDGKRYTSNRIYHPFGETNHQEPEYREWLQSFPVGRYVTVHYDAADPEGTAVLRPGLQGFYLFNAMQLTVFHAIPMAVLAGAKNYPTACGFFFSLACFCFTTFCLVGATVNPTVAIMKWAWIFVFAAAFCAATKIK